MSWRLRLPGGVPVVAAASLREVVEPIEGEGEAGARGIVFLVWILEAAEDRAPLKAARWLSKYDDIVVSPFPGGPAAGSNGSAGSVGSALSWNRQARPLLAKARARAMARIDWLGKR